jgi:CRP-like cAMP-binding protein
VSPDLAELRPIGFFAGLNDEGLHELLAEAQKRRVEKDAVIFREGGAASAVHVLTEGFAKLVQTTPNGTRVIVRYVGPGEPFGTPALLGAGRYPVDALAVTDGIELQWPARVIGAMLRKYPELALNAIAALQERLREAESRLSELCNEPVEQRIALAVARLVRKIGQPVGQLVEVPFPVTQQDIADMTGSTLHTVSRTLGAWQKRGLIERGRQHLAVADLPGLLAIAEAKHGGEGQPRRTHRRGFRRR